MDTYLIWGVSDKWSWLSGLNRQKGLIYDDNLQPKPAFDSILVRLQTYEPPQDTSIVDSCMADSCDSTNVVARTSGPGSVTMHVSGHTLLIAGTQSANVELFDMQGRPVFSAKCENGSVELKGIPEGLYVARVRSGSASLTNRIAIK